MGLSPSSCSEGMSLGKSLGKATLNVLTQEMNL